MSGPDVVIVGGGPAGLAAAAALAPDLSVVVLDREDRAGGIPRHCHHGGFGVRDLRRVLSGPAYADRLVERALGAGADLRTQAMVTGWAGERALEVTSPRGREVLTPGAVVLATGARERSRAARFIAGSRVGGVYTTGALQQLVHLHGRRLEGRAVVVGAELVSWSAVLTLRQAGARPVLLTSTHARPEVYGPVHWGGRAALGVTVAGRTRVAAIHGSGQVSGVELVNLDTGARTVVPCELVVLTGDWVPDHELATSAALTADPVTRGPRVDAALRTSRPGVFAAGNLVHPVDTADIAALDGSHVAAAVRDWVTRGLGTAGRGEPVLAGAGLTWVSPGWLDRSAGRPARGRLLAWPSVAAPVARVVVHQGGLEVARRSLPWPASPGRVLRIPWSVLDSVMVGRGPVTVSLR
jgi:thioredoxin reductase